MKNRNNIFSLTLVLFFITTFAQAQFKNIGVGLAYGSEITRAGIIVNSQYFVSNKLAIVPSLILYIPENQNSSYNSGGYNYKTKSTSTVWELNADVNYYFFDKEVKLYAIGGLNVTGAKSRVKSTSNDAQYPSTESSSSDSALGINLGMGVDFKAGNKVIPFAIIKYTASEYDQLVLAGGVRFILK